MANRELLRGARPSRRSSRPKFSFTGQVQDCPLRQATCTPVLAGRRAAQPRCSAAPSGIGWLTTAFGALNSKPTRRFPDCQVVPLLPGAGAWMVKACLLPCRMRKLTFACQKQQVHSDRASNCGRWLGLLVRRGSCSQPCEGRIIANADLCGCGIPVCKTDLASWVTAGLPPAVCSIRPATTAARISSAPPLKAAASSQKASTCREHAHRSSAQPSRSAPP